MTMRHLFRAVAAALAGGALLTAALPSRAEAPNTPRTLVIGKTSLFEIRKDITVNGRRMSVQDRINQVQDVFNRHLGGAGSWSKRPSTSTRPGERGRMEILLGGDVLLVVTPEDAKAAGFRDVRQLTDTWLNLLKRTFAERQRTGRRPNRSPVLTRRS